MPKIIHQRNKCIGCGTCAAICPKFFEINKNDGFAVLKNSKKIGEDFELNIDKVDCIKDAAEACPVGIIKIIKK
ncbi:ferredoxin [Candidatus Wolfebacteria bacterium CG03_land_8_20_14_0_80_40_12]|uniref:Ferredoxin n=1 Tax=Candidatus Wolfebacteria bacterium CG03_land_8_20_14_0_80_40_12 TaxID=1975069 RepID=A0A2M7B682_9BACT|nr:MAG: ferredoxin [Candidatus Wolfebacteria bacterium CG03_land_8_20_14_0_80_40_12]